MNSNYFLLLVAFFVASKMNASFKPTCEISNPELKDIQFYLDQALKKIEDPSKKLDVSFLSEYKKNLIYYKNSGGKNSFYSYGNYLALLRNFLDAYNDAPRTTIMWYIQKKEPNTTWAEVIGNYRNWLQKYRLTRPATSDAKLFFERAVQWLKKQEKADEDFKALQQFLKIKGYKKEFSFKSLNLSEKSLSYFINLLHEVEVVFGSNDPTLIEYFNLIQSYKNKRAEFQGVRIYEELVPILEDKANDYAQNAQYWTDEQKKETLKQFEELRRLTRRWQLDLTSVLYKFYLALKYEPRINELRQQLHLKAVEYAHNKKNLTTQQKETALTLLEELKILLGDTLSPDMNTFYHALIDEGITIEKPTIPITGLHYRKK